MNTSFLDDIFTISHNGKDVIERKGSDNKILWERAIPKTTDKGASISLTNTRKTGGDGVTYPVFTPSQVLQSVIAYGKCTQSGTPTPDVPVDIVCNNGIVKASGQTVYVEGTSEVITVTGGGIEQTASVADLFAAGEYEDTQNAMTGVVTRNVGIEIFDGTEDWKSGNNTGLYYISLTGKKYEKSVLVSTHFTYSSAVSTQITHGEMMCGSASVNTYFRNTDCATLGDWEEWLATQYTAGTPVMVVYPLATPQTEQALLSEQIELDHKGTYTLTTSGSVSDLLIQATYLGR